MQPSIYFQAIGALVSSFRSETDVNVLKSAAALDCHLQNKTFFTSCVDFVRNNPNFVTNTSEFVANFIALTSTFSEFPAMTRLAKTVEEIVKVRQSNDRLQVKERDGAVALISTEPLCSEDLDRAQPSKCEDPECTLDHSQMPVVLASPCHSGAPMYLTYKDGIVITHCCVCRREAFALRIASRE